MALTDVAASAAVGGDVYPLSAKGQRVVSLSGEHDLSTAGELVGLLARAVALGDSGLVVDLHGVRFMDASTIGVLVRARVACRRHGRSFALRSPSTCSRRVLDICGLTSLIEESSFERLS